MRAGERLARVARWVWVAPSPVAVASRLALLPAAVAWRTAVTVRNIAFDRGVLAARRLPVPSIGIGNLSVGGTGKTPLTIFMARELAKRGLKPGIVLRGYGGDELIEHRAAVPGAVVEADRDRHRAAARAVERGAQVLVLDDCLQRRDVMVDEMIAVVGAETWSRIRWPLPAGPWRETVGALRRAGLVVVTRKLAGQDEAEELAEDLARRTRGGRGAVAHLALGPLEPLLGGPTLKLEAVKGRVVTALCGVGEPDQFAGQLERAGAWVELMAYPDHHPFTIPVVARLAHEARLQGRWVVTTVKDAVKLLDLWPPEGAPCYVACLSVRPTAGADALAQALDRVSAAARTNISTSER